MSATSPRNGSEAKSHTRLGGGGLLVAGIGRKWYNVDMRLYHGSNCAVEVPELVPQVRALDFGRAFYLTSDIEQASRWARTSVLRRREGEPLVSVFEMDEARLEGLSLLKFLEVLHV